MNPLTNVKNLQKLNERELELGVIGKKSWHDEYKDSAWIFIGGLPYDLSEGDIICVFSQYGEIVNFNLIRDHKTGKSKGFAFLCFEDQRSTVLSVDNLNGIKILGRIIRVDHVKDYKVPKDHADDDEMIKKMKDEGCAPKVESSPEEQEEASDDAKTIKKSKKEKKKKKKLKKAKKKEKRDSSSDSSDSEEDKIKEEAVKVEIKQEQHDRGYDKALNASADFRSRQRGGDRQERDRQTHSKSDRSEKFSKRQDTSDSEQGSSSDERGGSSRKGDRNIKRERDMNGAHSQNDYRDRSAADGSRRERDWDRDRDREQRRDRGRERDKERERDRGRERERSRERDRDYNRVRDNNYDRDEQRQKDRGRDRDEERYRERDRQRRDNGEQGRHRDRSRERDRYR